MHTKDLFVKTPYDKPINGQKTVTASGTAEALGSKEDLISGVVVKALLGNGGIVYVGDSNVSSSNGLELDAGESVFVECRDISEVYIDADTNGEGVSYLGG